MLRNVTEGNASDYFILAEEMEERDLHYSSVLRTCAESVVFVFSGRKRRATMNMMMLADAVRDLIEQPQIPELLFDLLDGLAWCGCLRNPLGTPVTAGNPATTNGLTRVSL